MYRARDTLFGREVALKFINPQYQQDPDHLARLLKEARAAAIFRSPAIATTYDIGEHEGTRFLIMELADGELLSDRLQRGPLSISQAVDIGLHVADALEEAHTLRMVHRDVKSVKLILTERGLVKMLDFGLAKFTGQKGPADAAGPTIAQTQFGTVVGTVSYMSPEQALGRPVDHRSDLFSLGVVLHEHAHGTSALRRRHPGRCRRCDPAPGASGAGGVQLRSAAAPGHDRPQDARKGSEPTLPERRRSGDRSPCRAP